MENNTIAAIILTYNEEKHIARCISSLKDVCDEIVVVDSFSTDSTCEIASAMECRVMQHRFENQAQQFNWAIDNIDITTKWIWRVDADEIIEPLLAERVTKLFASKNIMDNGELVTGIYVNKKIVFCGKALMHGGWYPASQIKIFRRGYGRCENKMMDEHIIVTSGRTMSVDGDQTDINLNDLTWWTEKHNRYASREAVNMMAMARGMDEDSNAKDAVQPRLFGNDSERKRWFKIQYAKMPLFVRPMINFFVRYVLKMGFRDRNLTWYVLQGFWYRYLVDAKINEIMKQCDNDEQKIRMYIKDFYVQAYGEENC